MVHDYVLIYLEGVVRRGCDEERLAGQASQSRDWGVVNVPHLTSSLSRLKVPQ